MIHENQLFRTASSYFSHQCHISHLIPWYLLKQLRTFIQQRKTWHLVQWIVVYPVLQFLQRFCFSVKTGKWLIWSSLISFDGSAAVGGLPFTCFCGTEESLEGRPLLQDNGLRTFPTLHGDSATSVWNGSKMNWSFFEIFCCCRWRQYRNQLLVIDIPMQ